MKLAVIGASRGIGRKVVEEALDRGHHVRALARSATSMSFAADGFEAIVGDATNEVYVFTSIDGCDAV